jgi:hypothetical protein
MPCASFERDSVLEYLNEPVTNNAECEDATESELEQSYRKLIMDIASACHHIRKLITVKQSDHGVQRVPRRQRSIPLFSHEADQTGNMGEEGKKPAEIHVVRSYYGEGTS